MSGLGNPLAEDFQRGQSDGEAAGTTRGFPRRQGCLEWQIVKTCFGLPDGKLYKHSGNIVNE